MMPFVYTILIPVLIIAINYLVTKNRPQRASDYINILVRSLPHQYGYMFFLYYLGNEKIADTGWAPITLITFLNILIKKFTRFQMNFVQERIMYYWESIIWKNK